MVPPVTSSPSLLLVLLVLLDVLLLQQISHAQQIGSFFTAIYLNGAPLASYQSSCANMGQSQYCCGAGQSCAWDDAGKVACCPSGSNCQGSPYGSSAPAGGGGGAYTTTIYQSQQPGTTENCKCESTLVSSVVPVAPPSTTTVVTSYYAVPTSTYYPPAYSGQSTTTTTVQPGQGGVVTTVVPQGGGGGGQDISIKGLVGCASVSTITAVNVGQPVRTVGCLIVINDGSTSRDLGWGMAGLLGSVLGLVCGMVWF